MLLALDVPLFYDEAYYFGWARELAFGYFSKPPMVAWSIALTTIATDSSWAVRLSSPLFYAVAAILFGVPACCGLTKSAAWAGGIFLTLPLVGFNSMFRPQMRRYCAFGAQVCGPCPSFYRVTACATGCSRVFLVVWVS
ncbi:MAG: hypothetical protein CM15mP120_20110 [Pseudomonadota bacterium]|nr:MAG: hypothetical protein CM15mP120_20110 [Pseudomonadota bacterium]